MEGTAGGGWEKGCRWGGARVMGRWRVDRYAHQRLSQARGSPLMHRLRPMVGHLGDRAGGMVLTPGAMPSCRTEDSIQYFTL